ncbi:MAG TPA: hypothetical protein VF883_25045 [Thermoanaerobaculia bacterium]|jgi:hypothetical protein
MAKAQGKKAAAAGGKGAAKKVAAKLKVVAKAVKKKVAPKKPAPAPKVVAKKPVKPAPKPAPKAAAKPVKPGKPVKPAKPVKAAKPTPKAAAKPAPKPAKKTTTAVKAVAKAVKKAVAKVTPKAAAKPAPKLAVKPKAVKPTTLPSAPVAPNVPAVPQPAAAAPAPKPAGADEKKRGRRARPRVTSSGAPAASWLSSEKPRPASFIAAPARAEAPSAVAAPPASSDRLIRDEDLDHAAVRTVPVRIDVEQGAGRYYVIANPMEVSVRPGEGIEWDFRYLGGADVSVEEIVIELEKPSPFTQTVFRTRKPGGARPHRQLSGAAAPNAAGRRTQYTVRAINQFKTELASTKVVLNVLAS